MNLNAVIKASVLSIGFMTLLMRNETEKALQYFIDNFQTHFPLDKPLIASVHEDGRLIKIPIKVRKPFYYKFRTYCASLFTASHTLSAPSENPCLLRHMLMQWLML